MNNYYNKELRDRARAVRNVSVSVAGKLLWKSLLSRKQLGVGFKRQRPVGNYIVDFFCAEVRLIVEIDTFSALSRPLYEIKRQQWLEKQGYVVVRYNEADVLKDLSRVKTELVCAVYCLREA